MGGNVMRPALTDGGFVRSWKLNLRLTTRAEDSHAALYPYVTHCVTLLHAVRACSVVNTMAIRISNVNTWTMPLQFRIENW